MTSDAATEIRRRLQAEAGGIRLPSILGMLGALLLASGVIAFIAANWQLIPRVGKLTGVLVLVAAATGLAAYFERRNASRAADAAATAAALIFGAGVALVGQMYHLPADWPAGSVTVGIGAFTLALLLRSDGALIIAFACALSWLYGVQDWRGIGANPWYLLLYLPLLALALGRLNRAVHHMAVLAGAVWLGLVAFNGVFSEARIGGNIAYLLFLSVAFTAAGVAAQEGRLPPLVGACLPWGLLGYAVALSLQLMRSLEASASVPGFASLHVVASGVAGLAAIGVMLAAAQDRKFAAAMAVALLAAMATSIVFWMGFGRFFVGRILVAALVLASASAMVVAGSASAMRRITMAGTAAFGLAVVVLLYRTVGTLLDQSLFFLVGGALLIAVASGARRMLRRFAPGAPAS